MPVPIERRLGRIAAGFNSRGRKYLSRGVVSWETLVLIHAQAQGRCAYCGTELPLSGGTWDHSEALSEGGRNDVTNIVRCCIDCQRRKFTKDKAAFAAHKELIVACSGCGKLYKPRWAEWVNGRARYCSHMCAGAARWQKESQ